MKNYLLESFRLFLVVVAVNLAFTLFDENSAILANPLKFILVSILVCLILGYFMGRARMSGK